MIDIMAISTRSACGTGVLGQPLDRSVAQRRPRRSDPCSVIRKARGGVPCSAALLNGQEVAAIAQSFGAAIGGIADVMPESLAPVVRVLVEDAVNLLRMQPSSPGVLRLLGLYFLFFARPSPVACFIDFYVFNPVAMVFQKNWTSENFSIRERMGTGNFGTAFEAVIKKAGEDENLRGELTPEQKKRRVVLKRVNTDREGIRSNFLKFGTVARGAGETGQVESYMYGRIARNLFVKPYCADFKGVFFADRSIGSITAGSQWLVWEFESDSTLGAAVEGRLGSFPECVAEFFLSDPDRFEDDERDFRTVQAIIRKIVTGVQRLHSIGIVHRDIKPDNLLLTVRGDVKIIDFGAAADMSTGINFNPLVGILDPRYSPPEEYIVPQNFPRAPFPWLAVFLAPVYWQLGRPDLFDSFSVGMILMQMSVPQLRTAINMTAFANDLGNYFHDLDKWRQKSPRAQNYDFRLLDMRNGAGWDLAKKLICRRNDFLRGRLSAEEALRQRYFS